MCLLKADCTYYDDTSLPIEQRLAAWDALGWHKWDHRRPMVALMPPPVSEPPMAPTRRFREALAGFYGIRVENGYVDDDRKREIE